MENSSNDLHLSDDCDNQCDADRELQEEGSCGAVTGATLDDVAATLDDDQKESAEIAECPADGAVIEKPPDVTPIFQAIGLMVGQSLDQPLDEETSLRLLDEAMRTTEWRYEHLTQRLGRLDHPDKGNYENFDDLCDLGDKVLSGFGIVEENQIYKIHVKTQLQLTLLVLRAQNEALDFYEFALDKFGTRKDQALAAESEALTHLQQFLSKIYMEFHISWLKYYIEKC